VAHPESLAVISNHPDGRAFPVGEDEQASAQRVRFEPVAANRAEPIYAGAEINGINGHKDAHLGGDLNHDRPQKALTRSMR